MKTLFLIFCKTDLVLEKQANDLHTISLADEPPIPTKPWTHVMDVENQVDDIPVRAFRMDEPIIDNPQYKMCELHASFYKLPHDLYLMAGKCHELLYWDFDTKFCGICSGPMQMHTAVSKRCTQCGKEAWPQLATAVIALIHRGGEALLVHAKNSRTDFHGLVTGFAEADETLEETVHREVVEETGIKIENMTYFSSWPQPYPSGLMVGFDVDCVNSGVRLQCSGLGKGDQFSKNSLPTIPEKPSIAKIFIDTWLEKGEE